MTITSIDIAREFGDPDDDYDCMEKCVVRAIDALDQLAIHLDGYIFDAHMGHMNMSPEGLKALRCDHAVVLSLCKNLREWELGIPQHEVQT